MRLLIGCALLASASASFASYELGLLLTPDKIVRFDTETQINLGTFGDGRLNSATAITTNPVLGEAYVLHAGGRGVAVFDYSTGSFKRGISLGSIAAYSHISITPTGSLLLSGAYGSAQEFAEYNSSTGSFLGARGLSGGAQAIDFIKMPNGFFYGLARRPVSSSWEFILQTYNNTTLLSTLVLGSNTSPTDYKGLITSGNKFNITTNTNAPSRMYTAGSGGSLSVGGTWSYPFSAGPIVGNAFGHGDTIYSLRNINFATPNAYEMTIWDPSIMTYTGAPYVRNMPNDAVDFVTILAPEPSSMLAMAAGVWLLSRRRR